MSNTKAAVAVVLFLLVCYVPFLNEAVHIDDGNFIEMSKAIEFPFSVKPGYVYYWMGQKTGQFNPFNSTHPPGIPYYLQLIRALTGGYREYAVHAGFLLFPGLLALATWLFATESGIPPFPAILAVCANAAVLPVGHTLMADLPMLSLWMLGAYLLISSMKRNPAARVALSFGVMLVAGLLSYQTFLVLPAFLLVGVLGRRAGLRNVLLSFVFAAVLLLVYAASRHPSAVGGILREIARGLRPDRLANKGLSIPMYLGFAMLFILPLRYRDIVTSKKTAVTAGAAVLLAVPPVLVLAYPLWSSLWLILLVSLGLFSIAYAAHIAIAEYEDRRLGLFLLAWLAVVICYNLFVVPFGSVRYIMPAVPPLAFLFMKKAPGKKALVASGVLTAILGLAVSYGDYLYAASYRDFSELVTKTTGAQKERVWYIGEWGMHYYMEQKGFRYLTANSNEPRAGDLLMIADTPKLWSPSPQLYARIRLIDVVEMNSRYPIRTMGLGIKAGYYSTLWGYQPFALSRLPLEKFGVYSVYRN